MREFVEGERWCSGFSDYFRSTIKADMKGELRGGAEVDTGEIVGEITDELQPLQQDVETVNEKLDVVMESVKESDDEVVELATELRELLPAIGSPVEMSYEELMYKRKDVTPECDLETVHQTSDVQSWSIYLDEPLQLCDRALTYLEKYYPEVVEFKTESEEDDEFGNKTHISRYYVLHEVYV